MTDAYIYDHVRTPRGRGRSSGSLHEVPPIELITQVLQALQQRNALDTSRVDDVVLGVVQPVGEQGCDIARTAALYAGWDHGVPGIQINRFCSSGLDAVNLAAAQVMSGQAQLVVGGGVESMSRVAMGADGGGAWGSDPIVTYNTYFAPQGIGADLIATRWGYSRQDLDRYAHASQQRASRAWSEARFARSVLAVKDELGFTLLDRDEHIRAEATLADLAVLKPAFTLMGEKGGYDAIALQRYPDVFAIDHLHTAGNSSGIVDGAAGVLVGSREIGEQLGLKPRARIRAFASVGSEPTIMMTGPQPATEKALRNAGMSVADIDLFELNEAFASVVLRYMEALAIPHERINVNGGAIAMGHPLGATGAMILGTVLDELERSGKGTALATLCVGQGMGCATIIERI
ncbi:MAG: acetyl-CoA acetyltransferase [Hydrocarboniphaga sp.]|uniref:acetyl-CoA C-acetyltransferase n=1 Tax=Hydrocarboniphaga sp. TaxID=2033016 RepID=UPI00261A814F|nr:acetyl-CoA C-acetyltransferase [Hydrocarboniphaga sp.]MDB5969911.1 acetyl-CoA acetyltransferase [Hydrocarboniphaga sp.]